MSSAETIPVAPREIVDVVARILRINGVDPGTAHDLATDVMRCAAAGHPSIEAVNAAIADGTVGSIVAPHEPHVAAPDSIAAAHRWGIAVDEQQFRALERAARGFLVAEQTLDSIADTPTVD